MTSRNKPQSAQDLMAELEADPAWVARRDERRRKKQDNRDQNARDAEPLRAELASAGFDVATIAELYQAGLDYRSVIPLLLSWLPRIENAAVKESLVRALTVDWARPEAALPLIDELRRTDANDASGSSLRWAIANALAIVADESVFTEVATLAQEPQWGEAREMLTLALGNMHDPRAVDVLRRLLKDEAVAGHAVMALGELRATAARDDVQAFSKHPKAWIRKEAKRALAKLGD